jgi:hypothetical protein
MAEKELAAFVSAVSELFGSTEAQQSAKDWMKIVTLMCCQTRGASPDWRRVTITAAGRLASRVQFSDPGCFETRGTKRPFLVTRLFSQKRNNAYREVGLREVIAIELGCSPLIHLGQGDRLCMSRLNL